MHATTTHARRSCPYPTGTSAEGSHKSHWQISPGRYTVRWKVRGASSTTLLSVSVT